MQLTTHEKNIPQIRAAVQAYGEIWVHGDGNMFPVYKYDPTEQHNQDDSLIHSENYNRAAEQAGYRVKIHSGNIPKNKAELDRLLMQAKAYGDNAKQQQITQSRVANVSVNDSHYGGDFVEAEGEIDYTKFVGKK